MPNIPVLTLNDGHTLPALGFGLWRVTDEEAAATVCAAVAEGYRLLDTASLYLNEKGVGEGMRRCGLPREEIFLTTKVWNNCHGYDKTMRAFEQSLALLQVDYVDLYLIHWPVAGSELYLDTWRAMRTLRDEGRIRSLGVSNFLPHHIDRLIADSGEVPAVNQIERHPYFQQKEVVAANRKHGILTECWAPLGRGRPFGEPAIAELARHYDKTPAQVVLRWHIQSGCLPIPKTATVGRMAENIAVFDFTLTDEEMAAIDAIATVYRIGDDPDTFVDKK